MIFFSVSGTLHPRVKEKVSVQTAPTVDRPAQLGVSRGPLILDRFALILTLTHG